MARISIVAVVIAAFCIFSCSSPKPASIEAVARFSNVIPRPVTATVEGNAFVVNAKTKILFDNVELKPLAEVLASQLSVAGGFALQPEQNSDEEASNSIVLSFNGADQTLGQEGYELIVSGKGVKILAPGYGGVFYGVQTLRQLLPEAIESGKKTAEVLQVATGTIRDIPRFGWRGAMLDVARHFFSVEEVKQYIDQISFYKINTLHLGLSNDQGWRIEIKSWPNLTVIGGSTQVGGGKGGFYTQEEYRDIVRYAQSKNITIIPEIDMPGHTNAALASYGVLNNSIKVPMEGRLPSPSAGILGKDQPTQLYSGTEVGFSTLSFKKEATKQFIEDVIRELSSITPGPYIHIGGDEALVTPKPEYIQFVNFFTEVVRKNNKIMIGWEEIAQGEIDSLVVAQHWSNAEHAKTAAEKGAKIIMSPAKRAYLDMQYDSLSPLGLHWAAYIEVNDAYEWDPLTFSAGLDASNILGIEAALWGETIKNLDDAEYLTFPRLTCLAELAWNPAEGRSWNEFKVRLGNHAPRFKAMGINYYESKRVEWKE